MELIFIYGPVAAGKFTVARALAARTGLALFHNHLVVDAVAAVFPFGSDDFVRLREQFWLDTFRAAAGAGTSLIFTFAPEPTVAPDFAARVEEIVTRAGGRVVFAALAISPAEQEKRLADPGRGAFGKLRSVEVLRRLRADFDACLAAMPAPHVTIDSGRTAPGDAAALIKAAISA